MRSIPRFKKHGLSQKTARLKPIPRRFQRTGLLTTFGGRWSLLRKGNHLSHESWLENWAELLLLRYGVVFRDVLERESLAPAWGELVRTYRRMEAQGTIRGGRFILGVSGEQFAQTETFEKLSKIREARKKGLKKDSYAVLSSADPLNLVGIITRDPKVAASSKTRILFEQGKCVALYENGKTNSIQGAGISEPHAKALRLSGTARTYQAHLN